eukprot:TRINITY_DN11220_c0_g2_i1.p1 TRINITY_DN11220_c0_g2~~TRINITY_DN11220_c0_g2_i1.p1  ORF type:complete len:383 (-),score=64.72 TRINITY_DN11220_c0_g2_i1:106-1254(-)
MGNRSSSAPRIPSRIFNTMNIDNQGQEDVSSLRIKQLQEAQQNNKGKNRLLNKASAIRTIESSATKESPLQIQKNLMNQEEMVEDEGDVNTQIKSVSRARRHNFIALSTKPYFLTKTANEPPTKGKPLEIKFEKVSDLDKVHLEGTLDKYHPGFSSMYVPRECKVKPKYFEYYSSSVQYLKVPLRRILIEDIESASRVKICAAETAKQRKSGKYQFELIMKPGWDPKKSCFEESKDPEAQVPVIPRPHSATALRASRNHLMPKPLLLNKYKETLEVTLTKRRCKKAEGVWNVAGVYFASKSEAKAYREFVQRHGIRLFTLKAEERIEVKNPKKWINSLSGNHTWNNRELEWYLSEQRMLFSARSKEECKKWVYVLNWLMQPK